MSADSSFAWCSDCGYIGPDFKTEEYLPYVDEGREMPGGKTYECPKCGLTIGEQAIQEHFSTFESEVQGLREQLKEAESMAKLRGELNITLKEQREDAEAEVKRLTTQIEQQIQYNKNGVKIIEEQDARLAKARSLASEPCKTCDFKYPKCDGDEENDCPTRMMLKALGGGAEGLRGG